MEIKHLALETELNQGRIKNVSLMFYLPCCCSEKCLIDGLVSKMVVSCNIQKGGQIRKPVRSIRKSSAPLVRSVGITKKLVQSFASCVRSWNVLTGSSFSAVIDGDIGTALQVFERIVNTCTAEQTWLHILVKGKYVWCSSMIEQVHMHHGCKTSTKAG